MSNSNKEEKELSAIFANSDACFANESKDRVRALHEYFDKDKDGFLNFEELRSLQFITGGDDMDEKQYVMVCRTLDAHPKKGISLDALHLTYAAEGTNVDQDYFKVFPEKKTEKTKEDSSEDDGVIEVGEGGVDISP